MICRHRSAGSGLMLLIYDNADRPKNLKREAVACLTLPAVT
jgi:hypothetical protein